MDFKTLVKGMSLEEMIIACHMVRQKLGDLPGLKAVEISLEYTMKLRLENQRLLALLNKGEK